MRFPSLGSERGLIGDGSDALPSVKPEFGSEGVRNAISRVSPLFESVLSCTLVVIPTMFRR